MSSRVEAPSKTARETVLVDMIGVLDEVVTLKVLAIKAEDDRKQAVEVPKPSNLEPEPPLDADQYVKPRACSSPD